MASVREQGADEGAGKSWQPRALIVSLYGLYARDRSGWLSVASLVRLMADLGVDERAVRSAISRLKRRGLVDAERVGRMAGYRLSAAGYNILAEGDSRIFDRHRGVLDDGWLLVVFSVPEVERDKRHQLRSQLMRLGLGTVAPGIWIAPAHLRDTVATTLERAELLDFTELFHSKHIGGRAAADSVRDWWDLDALRAQYADFIARERPVLRRWRNSGGRPVEAFQEFVRVVTIWRRLPYLDPGLPLDALPAKWEGVEAEKLFAALREQLDGAAKDHVNSVLEPPAG
ncbi:PaaX family transcriptional regulator [Amycolatopsis sp. TRM77291]